MEKKNRYRTPVRFIAVFRVVLVCLLFGVVGCAFVYIRNQHVKKGDEIRQVEIEIAELDQQEDLWELRIAAAKDRSELSGRLGWIGSDLKSIDPARILKINRNE